MLANVLERILPFGSKPVDVQVGSTFRAKRPGGVVETAKVVEIAPDPMGIAHVRFHLVVERKTRGFTDVQSQRTLNLQTFASYFSELVEA